MSNASGNARRDRQIATLIAKAATASRFAKTATATRATTPAANRDATVAAIPVATTTSPVPPIIAVTKHATPNVPRQPAGPRADRTALTMWKKTQE